MTFKIEGDYIVFDHRRIARLLPNLALCDLRSAEDALREAQLPGEPEPEEPKEIEDDWRKAAKEKLSALAAISGGLLSLDEIEDALT